MAKRVMAIFIIATLIILLNCNIQLSIALRDVPRSVSVVTGALMLMLLVAIVECIARLIQVNAEHSRKTTQLMMQVDARIGHPSAEERRRKRAEKYGHYAFDEVVTLRRARKEAII